MQGQGPILGRYTVYDITADGLWIPRFTKHNSLMADYGFAAAKLFGAGDRNYRINKVYLEFENVADPGDAVSAPTINQYAGQEYYDGLVAPRDYLRLDVMGNPLVSIADGYEDAFEAGVSGNVLTFLAQTTGVAGVNGVEFSDSVNSKAFGLALVAAPVDADRTQDLVCTRGYWDTADQKVKQASGQIGVSWDMEFTLP